MKVNRAELKDALEKVRPGLAKEELVEQATSFAFLGDRVVTYNDEISVSHPVNNLNLRGAIKAEPLYAFLSKLTAEEVDITFEEDQVLIKAGRSRAGFALQKDVTMPIEDIDPAQDWADVPEGFLAALQSCLPYCARDMSRPILTSVFINGKTMVASDSHRIVSHTLKAEFPGGPFLLPARAGRELVKYDVKQTSRGTRWVHFRTAAGTVFSSRLMVGEFPAVARFLAPEGQHLVFPKGIGAALDRARIFARPDPTGDHKMVSITLSNGRVRAHARNEYGWVEEDARIQYDGDPITFDVAADFLISMFDKVQECTLASNRIRFAGDGWVHVVAVVAPRKEAPAPTTRTGASDDESDE